MKEKKINLVEGGGGFGRVRRGILVLTVDVVDAPVGGGGALSGSAGGVVCDGECTGPAL